MRQIDWEPARHSAKVRYHNDIEFHALVYRTTEDVIAYLAECEIEVFDWQRPILSLAIAISLNRDSLESS